MRPSTLLAALATSGLLILFSASCAPSRCPVRSAHTSPPTRSTNPSRSPTPTERPAPISAAKRKQLQAAAEAICSAKTDSLGQLFAGRFRRNRVLNPTLKEIADLRSRLGPCQKATLRPPDGVVFHHRDRQQIARLYLEEDGKISGIWFDYTIPNGDTLQAVAADLKKLPGQVSLTVRDAVGARRLVVNADTPLAVGSTFKLYVFKALLSRIRAGTLRWEEVISLDKARASTGLTSRFPDGHAMTVGTLAAMMLMRSDNAATDHLLHRLGRESVEQVAGPRNTPLISTLEMYKLQDAKNRAVAEAYLKADVAQRRRLLASLAVRSSQGFGRDEKPASLAALEWFYSTNELCRVMLELKNHPLTRLNRGPARQFPEFDQVAFKGGFEPGVVNFTFALRHASTARWTCVSVTYNASPEAKRGAFVRLRKLTLRLLHALGG